VVLPSKRLTIGSVYIRLFIQTLASLSRCPTCLLQTLQRVAARVIAGRRHLKDKRHLIVAIVSVACMLYIWQVVSAWADVLDVGQYEAADGLTSTRLNSTSMPDSATAILFFDRNREKAVMQLMNLPTLPATQVYQMWCIADTGEADRSSIFRISIDGQDSRTVIVFTECQHIQLVSQAVVTSVPHMVGAYHRFRVTIEPIGGSKTPSGPVVLAN